MGYKVERIEIKKRRILADAPLKERLNLLAKLGVKSLINFSICSINIIGRTLPFSTTGKEVVMKAMVQKLYLKGRHGPYAVAVADDSSDLKGSFTFSLKLPVWNETKFPEEGEMVVLSEIRLKRLGWRAESARFFRSQDSITANSERKTPEVSEAVKQLVAPLEQYWSTRSPWSKTIGGSYGSSDPKITHADYFLEVVLPQLAEVCSQFGTENVVRDLVQMVLPVYRQTGDHERSERGENTWSLCSFWGYTIQGRREEIPLHRTNSKLAAVLGVKAVYGPILSLGGVHGEANVFSPSKFFYTHACRMGEVIARFGEQGLVIYTDLCKKLLYGKIYDWSLELKPEQWTQLEPCIRKFGMQQVLEPMVDAMLMLKDIPGTKDGKYGYSFLSFSVTGLLPYIVLQVMAKGPREISSVLNPIAETVLNLHKQGAFRKEVHSGPEREFFGCFKELLPVITTVGIRPTLQGIRTQWKEKLIPA